MNYWTQISIDYANQRSYIAFLKRDSAAIARNPKTINRICGRLYEMGLETILEKCTEPKETN